MTKARPQLFFLAAAFLFALGAATLMGCAHGLDRGTEALEAGDFERAESIARTEISNDSASPWGNQLLAESLVARGEYRQALPYARRAAASETFPLRSPLALGQIYAALNRPVDAAEQYHLARQVDSTSLSDADFTELLVEAITYSTVRRDHESEWRMRSWLAEISPEHNEARGDRIASSRRAHAAVLRQRGEYLAAASILEEAMNDDPRYLSREALELGEIYARLNMEADAAEAWQIYIAADVDDEERRQRHLDVAEMAARFDLYDVAIDVLQIVLTSIDEHERGELLLEMAQHQLRNDQRVEAQRTLNEYLELATAGHAEGQAPSIAFRRAAELAMSTNNTRLAINILERGTEQAQASRTLTRQLADIYARRAQLEAVEEVLNRFIERHEDELETIIFAANWARERNNFELARHYFERAAEYSEAPRSLWLDLAGVLAELDDFDAMIDVVHTFLRQSDHDDQSLTEAAALFTRLRLFEDAEPLLQRLLRRHPDSRDNARLLSSLYVQWERSSQAASVWEGWITARGQRPADIEGVAHVFYNAGDLNRAAQFFERAGNAGQVQAWLRAADIYLNQDHHAAMSRALDAYLQAHSDRSIALEDVASRYRRARMTARHVDALFELVALRPRHWRSHETLSTLLFEQGRSTEAFEVLQNFVDAAPDITEALELIGTRMRNMRQTTWLIEFYRPYTEADAVDPALWRLMGDAYYSLAQETSLDEAASNDALRRARNHYMRFLDETADSNQDWRGLSMEWVQRRMWRPAARAFERQLIDGQLHRIQVVTYAETLLQLGEVERAEEVLSEHFQRRNRASDVGTQIARLLMNFQRYDEAEEYARHLFLAGDANAINEGFTILAEILSQQEDLQRFDDLVSQFLDRSANRTRARRMIIAVLENHGRWQQAVDALEAFGGTVVDQVAFQRGVNQFRAGHAEQALLSFEEAAAESTSSGGVWRQAGGFFAARGAIDEARRAYDMAAHAAPEDPIICLERGLFLIAQGDLEEAWPNIDYCLRANPDQATLLGAQFFEALDEAGQFDLARQIDARIDSTGQPARDLGLRIASWDLRTQDPATAHRAIERLQAHSWGIAAVLPYLSEAGRHQEIRAFIDEEFRDGDPTTAAIFMLTQPGSVVRFWQWTTQREFLRRIVDPLQRSDTRLIGAVGDYRARSGQYDDARLYLQAATHHRDYDYLPQLAHTLLLLGEGALAMDYFQDWLLDSPPTPQILESILLRYELAGDPDGASLFLDRIVEEPALLHVALPQKIHYELEGHGDPERAVGTLMAYLESAQTLPAPAFRSGQVTSSYSGLSREEIIATALVRSLETIAALGHIEVVEELLESHALPIDRPGRLDPLRLKIAVARGDVSGALALSDEILDATDGIQQRQDMRLRLAKQFIAFGVDEPARRLVDDALADQTDFRSHAPFALHLGLLLIEGQRDDLIDDINAYLSRVPNRVDARRTLIDELRRLGRDDEALILARRATEVTPTPEVLRRALIAALDAGDAGASLDFARRYIVVADAPFDPLNSILAGRLHSSEAGLILPIIAEVRRINPANLSWVIKEAQVRYLDGQIEEARQLLLDSLDERGFHREAITDVVDMLSREGLHIETARIIAPVVDEEAHWPGLLIRFAQAEFALGFPERAASWLHQLDETAQEPDLWRLELGERLAEGHHFQFIEGVIDPVLATESMPPLAIYLRGLARLARGESAEGLEDLRRANAAGISRLRSHYAAIQAALDADDAGATRQLMTELALLPLHDGNAASAPLQIALRAAINHPNGPPIIRAFLEEERPRLVDGHGATWTQFAGQLAGSFERTDDPEGAYGFYRDRIRQSLFVREEDRALPIYLNNLAYTYSTTNAHIDRGIDKIYRAIVLSNARNGSYIDTLGWLLYRAGETGLAEAEIRRALRGYDGPPSGLRELYSHLYQILEERGIYDRSSWIDAYLSRLPVNDIEW